MNCNEPLSVEERQRILSEINQRQTIEQQALAEEKAARQVEAQQLHREELARTAQKLESERRERLTNNLTQCLELLEKVIQSFSENDEAQCYRLLAKLTPNLNSTMHQMNRPLERPAIVGIPTLKVRRAGTAQGWCIVNAEDVLPTDEIIQEDA
jgi:uncharacterized protein YjcR